MFYSVAQMRTWLTGRVNLTNDATTIQIWQDDAMLETIDAAWWRITDVTWADLTINGTLSRWFLPGEDIAVLPPSFQSPPTGLAAPPYYLNFTDVDWRQNAPDDVIVEQGVTVVGAAATVTSAGGLLTSGGTIAANTVPRPNALGQTLVRVWYQRRVPTPDFTVATGLLRAPGQYMRIGTLAFYLKILAGNQAGGDMRQWRKDAEEYLQQAAAIYREAVPIVNMTQAKQQDWLVTGVPS